ncbi:hypothetical protein K525DRAFT_184670 [Schizophyllum commune Loenen D]|nr:hypothetical protein K525DRAFT_184670 [Schizophyllum commune Loenen D]
MPACTFCLKNMEGITEMYASRKCHKVFCGSCLDDFSRRNNDRFTCPVCRLIHSKLDFDRIVSPLEDIDEEKPRNHQEALIAYQCAERQFIDRKPNWAALTDKLEAQVAYLKAQLRSPESPEAIAELDAAISSAEEELARMIALLRELEAKAKAERAIVDRYRGELARVTAKGDAQEAALQSLADDALTRLRDTCETYEKTRLSLECQRAFKDELHARDEEAATQVAEAWLRDAALQKERERLRKELNSRGLGKALVIFKILRMATWICLTVILTLLVFLQARGMYMYAILT